MGVFSGWGFWSGRKFWVDGICTVGLLVDCVVRMSDNNDWWELGDKGEERDEDNRVSNENEKERERITFLLPTCEVKPHRYLPSPL